MLSAISTSESGSGSPCESEDPLGAPPPTISAARPFARLRGGAGAEKREAIGCLAAVCTSEGP